MARPLNPSNWGGDASVAMTATGTTAGTAATVLADHVLVTTSTSTNYCLILRALNAGEICSVANGDSTESINVFPPTGMKFNNQTANLHVLIPAGKSAIFIFLDATNIIANVSA